MLKDEDQAALVTRMHVGAMGQRVSGKKTQSRPMSKLHSIRSHHLDYLVILSYFLSSSNYFLL